ncbi:MAG TPA: alpha/beta hydrolase, partial [Rhodobiaceae bacterium]|nr:alpha/beta hydrolase [Rhodobiaceae bacterium]
DDPLASPLLADLKGLPPLFLQVGDAEVLLDDSREFEKKARAAGVDCKLEVWDRMIHVWHAFFPMLPEGEQAIDGLSAFLKVRWRQEATAQAI